MRGRYLGIAVACLATLLRAGPAFAADWPEWRCDARRSAASPENLPADLHLEWVRRLPAPAPAWPASQTKLQFDASYEPVVAGKRLFVGSMVSDRLTAYDTATGKELWRFYCDGPVRLAPVADKDKVYVVSDDGFLYCLDAAAGRLVWKFRGGPADRRVLGNDRLISTWPARGGPVLIDGTIYFAAGIWPFMGTFIHAVEAETGRTFWTNSGSGAAYTVQQHGSAAFAGAAPQGYLAVAGDSLLVSGGRTVPAVYDRADGALHYFLVSSRQFGKGAGGYEVVASAEAFFNGGAAYVLKNGDGLCKLDAALANKAAAAEKKPAKDKDEGDAAAPAAGPPVLADDCAIVMIGGNLLAYADRPETSRPRPGSTGHAAQTALPVRWRATVDPTLSRLHLKAGGRFYASGPGGRIAALEIPAGGGAARIAWEGRVDGDVWTLLAADGRLFAVTRQGGLYAFGAAQQPVRTLAEPAADPPAPPDRWSAAAQVLLRQSDAREGYGVVLGVGTGRLIEELLRQSSLRLIAVDPDEKKIAALRDRLDRAGLYGRRVAAHVGDPAAFPLPPYLAGLVACEDTASAGLARGVAFVRTVFSSLRPYGGRACLALPASAHADFARAVAEAGLEKPTLRREGEWTILAREGALPDSADWTHQYADVANTVVSQDARVRAPLGLLWFGGPPNDPVLPRHGHGPTPQVIDGRLLIEGRHMLRAVDVYTGRLLWQQELKDIGQYYDNTSHQPGANEIGSNYACASDGIYVAHGTDCVRLDPATGRILSRWPLPSRQAADGGVWGYVGIYESLLIATAGPLNITHKSEKVAADKQPRVLWTEGSPPARYSAGSRWLLGLDRSTGKVLWEKEAAGEFRHNAIAAGGGKVFCFDALTDRRRSAFGGRGLQPAAPPTLYALDARTGRTVWEARENVAGTWLGYSAAGDILLHAGSKERDRAPDESGAGMVAYRGADGHVLWRNDVRYAGPCLLDGDTIIAQTKAFDLRTGRPKTHPHPLTGEPIQWSFQRNYGCNTIIGSLNLLTFRSAAAGFYDLRTDSGTGNLGGFKSGCTSNLVVADGVLNAPDYTRTCTCSYQNQCSLALVHDSDAELWTFNALPPAAGPIRRIGVNLGAPGDRPADNGTLWLEWPVVGGPSPKFTLTTDPAKPETFCLHSLQILSGDLRWVAASGATGLKRLVLELGKGGAERPSTVRLCFAEPADRAAGQRVFSVRIQGKEVLKDFDIVREAGGPRRAVVREFRGVRAGGTLQLDFTATAGEPLLCGLEVVAE